MNIPFQMISHQPKLNLYLQNYPIKPKILDKRNGKKQKGSLFIPKQPIYKQIPERPNISFQNLPSVPLRQSLTKQNNAFKQFPNNHKYQHIGSAQMLCFNRNTSFMQPIVRQNQTFPQSGRHLKNAQSQNLKRCSGQQHNDIKTIYKNLQVQQKKNKSQFRNGDKGKMIRFNTICNGKNNKNLQNKQNKQATVIHTSQLNQLNQIKTKQQQIRLKAEQSYLIFKDQWFSSKINQREREQNRNRVQKAESQIQIEADIYCPSQKSTISIDVTL